MSDSAISIPATVAAKDPKANGPRQSVYVKEVQVPEWEHIAAAEEQRANEKSDGSVKGVRPSGTSRKDLRNEMRDAQAAFMVRFDRALPPHKKYFKMSRKIFLIVLAAMLAILVLIIALAAGLSGRKSSAAAAAKNLPLPSNTATFTGELTYYGVGLGACGEVSAEDDAIVAVSHLLFDAAGSSTVTGGNSNMNPLCGKMLRAQRYDSERGMMRSVDLRVVDRCTGCAPTDLDTTVAIFGEMANVDRGRVDVTWAWLQPVQVNAGGIDPQMPDGQ